MPCNFYLFYIGSLHFYGFDVIHDKAKIYHIHEILKTTIQNTLNITFMFKVKSKITPIVRTKTKYSLFVRDFIGGYFFVNLLEHTYSMSIEMEIRYTVLETGCKI